MLSLGYPLSGDISLDGYRSENWTPAGSAEEAINAWLQDDIHTNTMLSEFRSDIGVGIATDGEQIIVVIETALQTKSGQMQYDAFPVLTALAAPTIPAVNAQGSPIPNDASQYIQPVAINTAMPNGDVIHEVQYGQTLWTLAIQYHTTIKQIQQLNNLSDTSIRPGQKLLVITGATMPAPPSATSVANTPIFIEATSTPQKNTVEISYVVPTSTQQIFQYSKQEERDKALGYGALTFAGVLLATVFASMFIKK